MSLDLDKPLLTEGWRDLLGIGGLTLTLAGLLYTIWQVRKTKSAAEAAENAAKKAEQEKRHQYQRYAGANVRRLVGEAKGFIDRKEYVLAALRLSDLADQAAHFGAGDVRWQACATELRRWEQTCQQHAREPSKRFAANKWGEFI